MNDRETDTGVFKRRWPQAAWVLPFLHYLTPALVGSAITSILIGLAYVFNSPQKDFNRLLDLVDRQQAHQQKADETLQQLVTGQAVMNGKVDAIADEVDRQRLWREKIEGVAEAPPHARRRH